MPMLVTKTYLVATESVDEAYDLTKPSSDKVETFAVGQVRPFDPNQQPSNPAQTVATVRTMAGQLPTPTSIPKK